MVSERSGSLAVVAEAGLRWAARAEEYQQAEAGREHNVAVVVVVLQVAKE
jgi:hypothetical protein